jgi:hypothetical protein
MNFATHDQVTARGFVRAFEDTETLYTHPDLPSLLFKRVPSLGAAIACGGLFGITSDDPTPLYGLLTAGATLNAQYHAGKIGHIYVPDQYYVSLVDKGTPFSFNAGFGATEFDTIFDHSVAYSVNSCDWHPFADVDETYYLAVITRVSDGCAMRSPDVSLVTGVKPSLGVPPYDSSSASPEALAGREMGGSGYMTVIQGMHFETLAYVGGSSWFGFMDSRIRTSLTSLISSGRERLIDSVDSDVQSNFASAFDQLIATEKYSDLTIDSRVRLYFTPGGTLSSVPYITDPVVTAPLPLVNFLTGKTRRGMPLDIDRTALAADHADTEAKLFVPRPFDVPINGPSIPAMFRFMRVNTNIGTFVWPSPNEQLAATAEALEFPMEVSFGSDVYPSFDIFASLNPVLVKSSSGPTMSYDDVMEQELERISSIEIGLLGAPEADSGSTEEQVTAATNEGVSRNASRIAAVESIMVSVTPTTRGVVAFVNDLDALVLEQA